jgi:hypothetical protein
MNVKIENRCSLVAASSFATSQAAPGDTQPDFNDMRQVGLEEGVERPDVSDANLTPAALAPKRTYIERLI